MSAWIPEDVSNPWALFDSDIDRVVVQCGNTLTPKWATRLAAFDTGVIQIEARLMDRLSSHGGQE